MLPNPDFSSMPKTFWACVRTVSQKEGYTIRGKGEVKIPTVENMMAVFRSLDLDEMAIFNNDTPTQLASDLMDYYKYRADILNGYVVSRLMDAKRAKREFNRLLKKLKPSCPIPQNKQKGSCISNWHD